MIGNPNVGKSTLLNALLGQKLSIITPKPQTTRHRIHGILNGDNYQIVFSDLPGLVKPAYKLQEKMMNFVRSSLNDSDLFLFMTDIYETGFHDEKLIASVSSAGKPKILALNKTDTCDEKKTEERIIHWKNIFPGVMIIPVSARTGYNLNVLVGEIVKNIPESPAYYPDDTVTDRNERFFVSEIIREKILLQYRQEIPYSSEVQVEEFEEKEKITLIHASLIVMRESQKMIILGKKGEAIRKLGITAREEIEKFLRKKVFLDIRVEVKKEWREDERLLKKFGYCT